MLRSNSMVRSIYLATLWILQLALIVRLAPPLALALRTDALAGLAPEGWPALLQVVAMGLAVGGTALALVFPGVALARHKRAGAMRFLGLPRWAIALAIAGVVILGAATLALALASLVPAEVRVSVLLVSRPALTGGLALTIAGVLCGELLRRSVPMRDARRALGHGSGRIEVTHPPELRTHPLRSNVPQMQGRLG
jgi:hypothetical protein